MDLRKNIFIKDESVNPYGTWKDRRSQFIAQKALNEGVSKLCLITSGNAGYSLAKYVIPKGIKVVSVVDHTIHTSILEVLRETCTQVIQVNLSNGLLKPEDVISLARENEKESIWDVTNGFAEAYEGIIDEIKDKTPDYIICPVGSGEAFVGMYRGLKKHELTTKLVGVGVLENPSFADKLATPWTPYGTKMEEIVKEGHTIIRLSEKEIKHAYETFKTLCDSEPSSTVVWAGLQKVTISSDDKVVVINSGRGIL